MRKRRARHRAPKSLPPLAEARERIVEDVEAFENPDTGFRQDSLSSLTLDHTPPKPGGQWKMFVFSSMFLSGKHYMLVYGWVQFSKLSGTASATATVRVDLPVPVITIRNSEKERIRLVLHHIYGCPVTFW